MADLNEDEVNEVLSRRKRIIGDIRWRKRLGYQEFSADVLSDEADYEMTLVGSVTEATGYTKLNLFVGPQPIAMLHRGKIHHNPSCERLTAVAHKHRWTDAHKARTAYVPADIDSSSWEGLFRSFLKECNIGLEGKFVPPSPQRRKL